MAKSSKKNESPAADAPRTVAGREVLAFNPEALGVEEIPAVTRVVQDSRTTKILEYLTSAKAPKAGSGIPLLSYEGEKARSAHGAARGLKLAIEAQGTTFKDGTPIAILVRNGRVIATVLTEAAAE